ncbi:MAG TPA: MBOAT family protein [Candidatus Hydrogenedentes bacterium]|nr:MBOAT family protein [Candidatus Hydrogenedentota bacterium]
MQFNSAQFLIFFALVVWAYFRLPYRLRWILLLAASYVFYMAWRVEYALLILASTLVDYIAGIRMARIKGRGGRTKYLLMSLAANLSLLFTFKYFNFFGHSLGQLCGFLDIPVEIPHLNVLLPVGISFYTFQTLSYTIEVYRDNQEPERHFGRFALYVAFFPQLVAGPIERPMNLLPQLHGEHDFNYERVRDGLMLMLWGMFKKVVVADRLAVIVDHVYGTPERYPGPLLVLGTVFFAFQIYCDFSGYSDIAIGAAKVFGVKLMRNFNRPYVARSVAEFWQRWHISLSTWFRDYVYIPLGGNRTSLRSWLANLMFVFVVSGLWHGANWTFLVWGALHGSFYIVGRLTRGMRQRAAEHVGLNRVSKLHSAIQILVTFALVCIGWIFFRADTLGEAVFVLRGSFTGWFSLADYGGFARLMASMDLSVKAFAVSGASLIFVLFAEWLQGTATVVEWLKSKPVWVRWPVYMAVGLAIMNLGMPEEIPFIYFQF